MIFNFLAEEVIGSSLNGQSCLSILKNSKKFLPRRSFRNSPYVFYCPDYFSMNYNKKEFVEAIANILKRGLNGKQGCGCKKEFPLEKKDIDEPNQEGETPDF